MTGRPKATSDLPSFGGGASNSPRTLLPPVFLRLMRVWGRSAAANRGVATPRRRAADRRSAIGSFFSGWPRRLQPMLTRASRRDTVVRQCRPASIRLSVPPDDAQGRRRVIDPTPLITEAGRWIKGFRATKRSREVGAAANVLYEAGVTVVLLRTQRERLYQVLGPLRDFRPNEWPSGRRGETIGSIRAVIHDPARWYDVMNSHIGTLEQLTAEPKAKVGPLCDEIEARARNVTSLGYTIYDQPAEQGDRAFMRDFRTYREKGLDERSSWKDDVRSNADVVGPDALIRDSLPALFWLIDNAEAEKEMDDLRRLANILLTTRSRRGDEDLDQVVGAAAYAFGELRGILLAEYPELPAPSWVELSL
jgi:hypothetical protein